jgi:hypothetical protein
VGRAVPEGVDVDYAVRSRLDTKSYPAGVKVSRPAVDALALRPESFHGDWNYTILPTGHAKKH